MKKIIIIANLLILIIGCDTADDYDFLEQERLEQECLKETRLFYDKYQTGYADRTVYISLGSGAYRFHRTYSCANSPSYKPAAVTVAEAYCIWNRSPCEICGGLPVIYNVPLN